MSKDSECLVECDKTTSGFAICNFANRNNYALLCAALITNENNHYAKKLENCIQFQNLRPTFHSPHYN